MILDGQGVSCSWKGETINNVQSLSVQGGDTQTIEATPLTAAVSGSGEYSRVMKQVLPASVEPASVSISTIGVGLDLNNSGRGDVGALKISKGGFLGYDAAAWLLAANVSVTAGGLPVQTLEFQFLGID